MQLIPHFRWYTIFISTYFWPLLTVAGVSIFLTRLGDGYIADGVVNFISAIKHGISYLSHFNKKMGSILKNKWKNYFNSSNQALLDACDYYNFPEIQRIIEAGVDVNCKDANGDTPLNLLIAYYTPTDSASELNNLIQILLSKGADPSISNYEGLNALDMAISNGIADLIPVFKQLVNRRCQLRFQGEHVTPLMNAVDIYCNTPTENAYKVVEALLVCGADPNEKCTAIYGRYTPFVHVLQLILYRVDHHPEKQKLCNLLLDKGANPFATKESEFYHGLAVRLSVSHESLISRLSDDQKEQIKPIFDRCIAMMEHDELALSLPKGIGKSKDEEQIDKVIHEALKYQAAGDNQTIEKLIDRFIKNDNTLGLTCLLNELTPEITGYALLHHKLAIVYLDSAKQAFSDALDSELDGNEYRRLAIMHCLKGMLSQETPPATSIVNELKRLYKGSLTEWKMEPGSVNLTNVDRVDIFDEVAKDILEGGQAQIQLFEMKKTQASSAFNPASQTSKLGMEL